MEDFFEAVDRAFVQGAGRNPAPRRLDLKTPVELSLSAPESSPATPSSGRRQPERCRQPKVATTVLLFVEETVVTHKRKPHLQRQGEEQ
jgi:hypothetical protein